MSLTSNSSLDRRLSILERKICCNRTLFYENLAAFPVEGSDNTLYVDESTGAIYIWDGDSYISPDSQVNRLYLNTASPAFTPLDPLSPTEAEAQTWVDANLTDAEKVNTEVYYGLVNAVIFNEVIHYPQSQIGLNTTGQQPATTQVLTSITIDGITTPIGLDSLDAANYITINATINAAILAAGYTAVAKITRLFSDSALYVKQSAGMTPLVITMDVLRNGVATTRTNTNTPVIDYPEELFTGSIVWSVINGVVKEVQNDYKDHTLVVSARARVPAFNAMYHKEGTTYIDTQYKSTYVSTGTEWINTVPEVNYITITPNVNYISLSPDDDSISILWDIQVITNRTIADHNIFGFQAAVSSLTHSMSSTVATKTVYNGLNVYIDERSLVGSIIVPGALYIVNNGNSFSFRTITTSTIASQNFSFSLSLTATITDSIGTSLTNIVTDRTGVNVEVLGDNAQFLDTKKEQELPRLLNLTTVERDSVVLGVGDAGKTIFNTTTNAVESWDGSAWTSGSSEPLVYKGLLVQSGTSDPTVTVLENTLGGTVVWARIGVGTYTGTLTGAFPSNKIIGPGFGVGYVNYVGTVGGLRQYAIQRQTDNNIILYWYNTGTGLPAELNNDGFNTINIDFEVYP